jgi:NAD-dependent SIR2 family protein deacetylase
MTDTVLILGAGFSFASGIPLLSGFVERMWQHSVRGSCSSGKLTQEDTLIFDKAMRIREELDGYHGRAMFDDRNIEDLLSILSFNVLAGRKQDKDKLIAMTRALARTIDLNCTVKHPGITPKERRVIVEGPNVYRDFWHSLFAANQKGKKLPAIITFNYDLVLERSLLQTLAGTSYGVSNPLPFKQLRLQYHYPHHAGAQYNVRYTTYQSYKNRGGMVSTDGSALDEVPFNLSDTAGSQLEILKLHGSLNFPRRREREDSSSQKRANLTSPLEDPFILPPVFNKMSNDAPTSMWQAAMERLRQAKNIIVVGYSLPQTDIYMQYFLKTALGPNLNLNQIIVFDPVLFTNSDSDKAMRARYESCFAPQLRGRIEFQPPLQTSPGIQVRPGTTEHFVHALTEHADEMLF